MAAAPLLTARELDVLACAAAGPTTGVIAPQLSISPATFKRHLENIFAKLGVRDRTAAVAFALRAELIDWLGRFGVLKFRLVGPSC